jgi:hypothetical protein
MRNLQFSKPAVWMTPFLLMVSILCVAQAPVPEPVTDQETELGQAVYNELRNKGEIIESLPPLRKLETGGRVHFPGSSGSLPPSLRVLPGPRTPSKCIRDPRWERLCSGLIAVLRKEH